MASMRRRTRTTLPGAGSLRWAAAINFDKRFALLAEYQFIDDKLPGKLIAETGANWRPRAHLVDDARSGGKPVSQVEK